MDPDEENEEVVEVSGQPTARTTEPNEKMKSNSQYDEYAVVAPLDFDHF